MCLFLLSNDSGIVSPDTVDHFAAKSSLNKYAFVCCWARQLLLSGAIIALSLSLYEFPTTAAPFHTKIQ